MLHPAANLHGPGFALFHFARVDFISVDRKDKKHERSSEEPQVGKEREWIDQRDKTKYKGEQRAHHGKD